MSVARARRRERGFTFVTLLFLLAISAGIYWIVVFGGAYWDNHEVKSVLRHAGNLAYTDLDDNHVRKFITDRMTDLFGYETTEYGRKVQRLRIEYAPEDLIIERTRVPPSIRIRLAYTRVISLPIIGGERALYFPLDIEQDLSPVDWGKQPR